MLQFLQIHRTATTGIIMAAPSYCCLFDNFVKLQKEWKPDDILQMQELYIASDCTHHLLKDIMLTDTGHGLTQITWTITPLYVAIEAQHIEMVKLIIEEWGVDVNAALVLKDNTVHVEPHCSKELLPFTEPTPLFVAALLKSKEIVRYLVGQGANISTDGASTALKLQDQVGLTHLKLSPLHAAFILLEGDNTAEKETAQLDIIRFLVESGADPDAFYSNTQFLSTMNCLISFYANHEGREIQYNSWMNPNAILLLIELGMSVTQKCPSFGTTAVHMLADSIIENVEDFVRLLLLHGADLQARDDHGFTPIMLAATGNNRIPNIAFLNHLLERDEIPNIDKIDALEVAVAVILSYETNADLFHVAFDYLARARQLRLDGSFPLIPQPQRSGRMEWITSPTNEQNIHQHQDEFAWQSILIRLRIFSAMSWQAVYQHLWPYLSLYFFNKLDEEDLDDQLLDILLTMLEIIQIFSPHEKGIWIATVEVVSRLVDTLAYLRHVNHLLYNVDTLKTSLQLFSNTYQVILDHKDDKSVVDLNLKYFLALVLLISMTAELEPTDIESIRQIVSQNGRCVRHGMTLFHVACYFPLPADNLLAVIKLLLQHGADPRAICNYGQGALHYLARGKTNRRDIEAAARLLLDMGLHLDQVDNGRKTAADRYKEKHPEAGNLPDWLQEGVPNLTCLSARVSQRHNIPPTNLPAALQTFAKKH